MAGLDPPPKVTYYSESGFLYIATDRPFGVGETIADGVVVYHDQDDFKRIVGICIGEGADVILQPFLDAVAAQPAQNLR